MTLTPNARKWQDSDARARTLRELVEMSMESKLAADALVALRQIIRATDMDGRQLAKQTGLTTSQLVVMQLLKRSPGLTITKLAERVSLRQATVTALIDKLESRSLVQRKRSDLDRRRVELYLTEEGSAMIEAAPTILQERFIVQFDQLEDWEQSFILAALQRVASMLDAGELDASPVLSVGALDRTEKHQPH
ncbi:transcriptional regulator, MarR family [Tepidicaulis marinus]|uniref:Transcriptional regulator, MarR family n=1 Tax=Tepidicaulis marinus TaxID=1333998 RepID=A0A081BBU1_9HYPH|nr:MarR family transcriptional regulator [Tepidicaulis marinus]GAK45509.1 transcriptional regulator, MarR family [Tepidicaulis marinus]